MSHKNTKLGQWMLTFFLKAHFDRERIPERVVHAKGAGAHGTFGKFISFLSASESF